MWLIRNYLAGVKFVVEEDIFCAIVDVGEEGRSSKTSMLCGV